MWPERQGRHRFPWNQLPALWWLWPTFGPLRSAHEPLGTRRKRKKAPQINDLRGCVLGAPDTVRTCDPCLRRAVLYPAELRARGRHVIRSGLAGCHAGALDWVDDATILGGDRAGAGL